MVTIREVGLREGVQISKKKISTNWKLSLLEKLQDIGFSVIEATSIVRKDLVPNHADYESILQVVSEFSNPNQFTALYLNRKGFEILSKTKLKVDPWIYTAVSEEFLVNNVGRDFKKERIYLSDMEEAFITYGFNSVKIMISTAFGFKEHIKYHTLREKLSQILANISIKVEEICLADTTGISTPNQIREFVKELNTEFKNISLHLHDTQGLGLLNAITGFEAGVQSFETSIAGVGGCPFLHRAAGNLATEELVLAFTSLGISSNVDLEALRPIVIEVAKKFKDQAFSKLAAKWMRESTKH